MTVTINAVRVLNRVHLSESDDISHEQTEEFIADVLVYVEGELNVTIGELSGDAGEMSIEVNKIYADLITNLSALYCLAHVTGGSCAGRDCQIGALNPQAIAKGVSIDLLKNFIDTRIRRLKPIALGIGEDTSGLGT